MRINVDVDERMREVNNAKQIGPFRRAVLRGLGMLLPPLLTIVILLWVANTVAVYLLIPLENATRSVAVNYFSDIRTPSDVDVRPTPGDTVAIDGQSYAFASKGTITIGDQLYHRTDDGRFVLAEVFEEVRKGVGRDPMPTTAKDIYGWYVEHYWLPKRYVFPIYLCLFLLVLYVLGKFLAAGVGHFLWNQFERIIHRLPLISNVYSSIKQVTDFLFTGSEMQYTRVVAIKYLRRGIWTLGFVRGETMQDFQKAANVTLVSAFVPHSPMPFTGFAVTVKKNETIDLNIKVDEAIQFIVSCGVVIPPAPGSNAPVEGVTPRGERLQLAATTESDV